MLITYWNNDPIYQDLLRRPIVLENINKYRKKILEKKLRARYKRKRKNKFQRLS